MKHHRKIAGLLVAGALSAISVVAAEAPAYAAGAYHPIVNYGSGKCAGLSPLDYYSNGARVVQQTCNGQPEQQWAPIPLGSRYYRFVNARSGMCMDVRNGKSADRTPVQQWTCTNTPGMSWYVASIPAIVPTQVRSKIAGKCLDVRGGSLQDGAAIQIYRCTSNNSAQSWTIN